MNYQKAKAEGLFLTAEKKVDHIIIETNGIYDVIPAKNWDGEIIETIKYEKETEPVKTIGKKSGNKGKGENKSEEVQTISELRDASSTEVLQSNGDTGSEVSVKNDNPS